MDLLEYLDIMIEEAVGDMLTPTQLSYLLLSEDFCFNGFDGPVNLLETVKRTRMKVAGGGYVTRRRQGRPNPRLSIIARRRSRNPQVKQKIKRAKARPQSKMRAAKTRVARKRLMPSRPRRAAVKRPATRRPASRGSYRGYQGAKRHAAPRRAMRRRR